MKISDEFQPVRGNQTVFGSISGNYAFRNQKTIWFESTLERDFLEKQEFDESVIDVVCQPIEIPYVTALGNQSSYTPDFLIQFSSKGYFHPDFYPKPILAEIKPRKRLIEDWVSLKPKFKAAMAFAKDRGWVFHVYDETRIHDQYLKNIRALKKFKRSTYDEVDTEIILDTLKKLGHCPINQLPAHIYKSETNILMGIHHVWFLVAQKRIACDLSMPLNQESLVWVNDDKALYLGEF